MSHTSDQLTKTAAPADYSLSHKQQKKSLLASTIGQLLEWYEWGAYAVFAPYIAAAIFNPEDKVAGLLATFGVFAVGFLMRPLGGIIFGSIADRKGRKFVLITTMLSMATASVAIGLLPGYQEIGIWAAILLVLARMVQGFAHGGESATANTYVAEIAPKDRRGQWGSLVYASIFGGTVIAYTLGGTITGFLSKAEVGAWGWRIPFLLGAVLALVALWLRRGMQESDVFVEEVVNEEHHNETTQASHVVPAGAKTASKSQVRNIFLVIGLVTGLTSAHYTWTSYVSTYAITQEGMAPQGAYWATVFAQLIALIALPFWGRLSDRVGRKPLLYGFAIAMFLLEFLLKTMIGQEPWTLFVASTIALLIVGMMGAIIAAVMSEIFPTATRTRNIGLAYSISVAVFGGFAPYLNQLFVSIQAGWLADVYVMLTCVITLICVRILPETRGIDLNDVESHTVEVAAK
ncbi:MFS transporter [Neomicrococcus lactis]